MYSNSISRDEANAISQADGKNYTYDTVGRLATATASAGSSSYTYDESGNLTEESGVTIQYDG